MEAFFIVLVGLILTTALLTCLVSTFVSYQELQELEQKIQELDDKLNRIIGGQ